MGKLPKIRCPVCGMRVWLRNLNRRHKIESWIVHFVKGFRGRIEYKKAETKGASLYDFWINHLEEVIIWLKVEKSRLKIQSLTLKPQVSPVLGLSVSKPMELLRLLSPRARILDVQNVQPTLSLVVNKSNLKLSYRKSM